MGAIHQVLLAGSRSYQYRRTVTIDHTKCGATDSSNFPVLFSGTYAYLATTANGGNVTSANGYDIIFTSDAAGTTKLDHEIETYTATTGAVNFWVRVPTVSHTADTVIYLWYGNSAVTTSQENVTGVWDTNFKGVWHLPNGTTLTANDSTGVNNGTINGQTGSDMAGAGQIDGAAKFDGTDDYINAGTNSSLNITSALTWSAWVNVASFPSLGNFLSRGKSGSNQSFLRVNGTALEFGTFNGTSNFNAAWTMAGWNTNTQHLLHGVWSGTAWIIYFDGVNKASNTTTGPSSTGTDPFVFATFQNSDGTFGTRWMNATIDEVRVSNTNRSADWITTEYNSQSSPSTFYTVGAAQ